MSNPQNPPKVALLVHGDLSETDAEHLNQHLFALTFNPKFHSKNSISDLFQSLGCVIFNVEDKETMVYLSEQTNNIASSNIKKVYITPLGVKMDKAKVKERLQCHHIVNSIPSEAKNLNDFLSKLLSDDLQIVKLTLGQKAKHLLAKALSCVFGK